MNNAEALHQAEDLLQDIKGLVERLQNAPRKVGVQLNTLLEEVYASHRGYCAIDQPLDTAWSLYNISMLETVRKDILPLLTNQPAASENELIIKFIDIQPESTNGETVQEVSY
jgi:hypothetical protein